MNKSPFFLLILSLASCAQPGPLKAMADLPGQLAENSGMVSTSPNTLWVIEDSGNKDHLYLLDLKGNILRDIKIKNAKNRDWEDLTKDDKGHIYIADTGNNDQDRKNLVIYKVTNPTTTKGNELIAQKIKFQYPDQKRFPPKKNNLQFDSEALFWHEGKLFIIIKNRSRPFDGTAKVYSLPDKVGGHTASLIGTLPLCSDYGTCRITAAAISPKGTLALLGYGKLWVARNFDPNTIANLHLTEIDLQIRTQLEALCFLDEHTLLLSDERSRGNGGNLYELKLPQN
ncbi:MAG: hypothetical protein AB3N16_10540 [Flavobacteriaceae bacterium]